MRGNGGVGARPRRDLKWALRAAPYPSDSRPPFPSRERIEAKAPVNPILPLGEVSRRDGGAGARSAEVFAHWRSHPLRPRLRQGYGEPTSPRAGKISTPFKSAPYSPSIHVVGGESSVFSGVDVRDVSVDPAGSSGHGRQQPRVREVPNPCYCINIRFNRSPACLSLQIARSWRFWCFPLIALLRQGYEGHFSPEGEG